MFEHLHLGFLIDTCSHLCVLVLKSLLSQSFLFFLSPADVGTPQRDAIRDEDVEENDLEAEPVVPDGSDCVALLGLKEQVLCLCHSGHEGKVEHSHGPTKLANEAATMNVMQQ